MRSSPPPGRGGCPTGGRWSWLRGWGWWLGGCSCESPVLWATRRGRTSPRRLHGGDPPLAGEGRVQTRADGCNGCNLPTPGHYSLYLPLPGRDLYPLSVAYRRQREL